MAPVQIATSIALLVISLALALVLLAGTTSSDCDVISEVPWGVFDINTFSTTAAEEPTVPIFSTTIYLAGRQFCDADEGTYDGDDLSTGSGGQVDDDGTYIPLDVAFKGCRDAGNVSLGFTTAVAVITVLAIVMTVARKKAASIILPILAMGYEIAAIGHYDRECLSELDDVQSAMYAAAGLDDGSAFRLEYDVTRSVGIYVGAVMVFLLALSAVLNFMASSTRKNPEQTHGGPLRMRASYTPYTTISTEPVLNFMASSTRKNPEQTHGGPLRMREGGVQY